MCNLLEKDYMSEALNQAKAAASAEEVPVGAVAVYDGKLIARAHNLVESKQDATMHAELIVLREAASILKRWRLSDVDIFVTLEPCPMCASALMLSRVRTVYFGAKDPRMGACGSLFDLSQHAAMPHQVKILGGLMAKESQELLQQFFKTQRES